MKKRRISALLVSLCLVLFAAAAGCSNGKVDNAASEKSGSSGTSTQAQGQSAPVNLLWYQIGSPQADTDKVFKEVSKYTTEKINATVKMVQFDWGQYNQKMQVISQSGEEYDICFTCSWANDYRTNAVKGAFVELNGLLDQYGKDIKKAINPKFLEGAKINGKLYAVPVNKEVGAQPVWNVNVGVAEKYGINYKELKNVKDIAALEPYLKKVKEGGDNKLVPLNSDGTWLFNAIAPFDFITSKFGIAFDIDNPGNSDYKVVNTIETPYAKTFAETMRKYYQAEYIRKDIVTKTDASELDKTGNWFLGAYHYAPLAEIGDSAGKGYKVDVAPMMKPYTSTGSTTGAMHAISVTSKKPEKAMMFLNLLNTDQKLRILVGAGIEGTHYTMENNRQIQTQEGKDKYSMPGFAIGNVFLTNLVKGDPDDKWQQYEKFNNDSVAMPALGFYPNTDAISNELAAINNVINEFDRAVFNGALDQQYLQKYITKMKDAGSDKVVAELQKQVDAWRKSKK